MAYHSVRAQQSRSGVDGAIIDAVMPDYWQNGSDSSVRHKFPINVLVLIPTLGIGGAEIDLTRTLPRFDRRHFRITVCTFLDRGELAKVLEAQGIKVVGPFSPLPRMFRRFLREACRCAKWLFLRPKRIFTKLASFLFLRFALRPFGLRLAVSALQLKFRALRGITALREGLQSSFSCIWAVAYLCEAIQLARPIARFIRESEIDVVHPILPNSYLIGACANLLAGRRPFLMSRVSLNLYQKRDRLLGWVERRFLHRFVDVAIGNSRAVLRDLAAEGIAQRKLEVLYNGIDVNAFTGAMLDRSNARRLLGISEEMLVFSVVANLHPYKGHKDLLHALATLPSLLPDGWLCLCVGRDVHSSQLDLEDLSWRIGVAENVRFLGQRSDVPVILSASDIHVSASHEEGLPNNIIEAMCARLPVVATAVGGVPELVVHGQTGYLVPLGDVRRMSQWLAKLAHAPGEREAFGAAAQHRVMRYFGIERNVAALESIYIRTLNRPAERSRLMSQTRPVIA